MNHVTTFSLCINQILTIQAFNWPLTHSYPYLLKFQFPDTHKKSPHWADCLALTAGCLHNFITVRINGYCDSVSAIIHGDRLARMDAANNFGLSPLLDFALWQTA